MFMRNIRKFEIISSRDSVLWVQSMSAKLSPIGYVYLQVCVQNFNSIAGTPVSVDLIVTDRSTFRPT